MPFFTSRSNKSPSSPSLPSDFVARDRWLLRRERALDEARAALAKREANLDARLARYESRLESLIPLIAQISTALVRSNDTKSPLAVFHGPGDCADEWHTAQCRTPVPHASEAIAPIVLDATSIAPRFRHTHGFPMFATNAAIVSGASVAHGVHTLRITPLALSCSSVEMTSILAHRYRDNSHALLVTGLDAATPRVLLNFSNAEDPRGIVHRGSLWLFYTTTIQIYHDGKVKPQELGRMELRRFDWPGNGRNVSLARLLRQGVRRQSMWRQAGGHLVQ